MGNEIYLDNAATTKPNEQVIERMYEVIKYYYGNSSSVHKKGLEANKIIKDTRNTIADIINCEPNEIVFTSGGSEANNLAIKGVYNANKGRGKHVITSLYEHPTILNTIKNLNNDVTYLKIDSNGSIIYNNLEKFINRKTILISLMNVNSEIGAINNIDDISKIAKNINEDVIFHTDNVQGFCKIPIDMTLNNNIDLMSMSAHKIEGPKGVGILYIRKNTKINKIIDGSKQQFGYRAGTLNTAGIAGLEIAAKLANKKINENYNKVKKINEYTRNVLNNEIENIIINSSNSGSPYILSVSFKNIKSEILLNHLSLKNIFISAGSACASRKNTNSHVLEAINIDKDYITGTIRISFNPNNNIDEINRFIKEVKGIIPMLRMIRRK